MRVARLLASMTASASAVAASSWASTTTRVPWTTGAGRASSSSCAAEARPVHGDLTRASAPTPSVEAILHALLPYAYVDHTHAEALLSITNTANGEARVREVYGNDVVVIPYVMPGFELARYVAEHFPKLAHAGTQGMVLMNHGLFSFGESARESYERMITLVTRAEDYLGRQGARASTSRCP